MGWLDSFFGGDEPETPAVDYAGLMARADRNEATMRNEAQGIKDFSQQAYDEMRPYTQQAYGRMIGLGDDASRMYSEDRAHQLNTYRPLERRIVQDAQDAGSEQQQQQYADQAVADATSGQSRAMGMALRNAGRYGLNGIAARIGPQTIGLASAQAGAANAGRTQAINNGVAQRFQAANLGMALPGAIQGAMGLSGNLTTGALNPMTSNTAQRTNAMLGAGSLLGTGLNLGANMASNTAGLQQKAYMTEQAMPSGFDKLVSAGAGALGLYAGTGGKMPWSK